MGGADQQVAQSDAIEEGQSTVSRGLGSEDHRLIAIGAFETP